MRRTPPRGLDAWAYALKPASWPKTLVPCALGQAAGAASVGAVSWAGLVLGLAFTALDTVFIVLLNDWGDREVDAIKRCMVPAAGSPKTIPDGILPAGRVLGVGLLAGVAAVALAGAAGLALGRAEVGVLGALAVATFLAYTFPPLKLNYRGGGELLEAVGVGAVLPAVNAAFQGGDPLGWPLLLAVAGYLPLALASASASGLSDEASDRAGGKRTVVTLFGNPAARGLSNASNVAGALVWAVVAAWVGVAGAPVAWALGGLLAAATVLAHQPFVARRARPAVTSAFAAQRAYKSVLHKAAWRGGAVLSIFLAWTALV